MAQRHVHQVVADLADMLRRRGNVMVLVFVLGCVVSLFYALSRPYTYRSTEIVEIVSPHGEAALATQDPAQHLESRMELLEQRLLGRQNLIDIAEAYDLFKDEAALSADDLVDRMRDAVRIENVFIRETLSALRISADMPEPEQARLVAQELSHRIINMNASARIERAREMFEFFTIQEKKLFRDMAETEDMMVTLQETGGAGVPGSEGLRDTEIASTKDAIAQIDQSRADLQMQISTLEKEGSSDAQRAQLSPLIQQMNTLNAQRRLLSDRRNELASSEGPLFEIARELTKLARHKRLLEDQIDVISARRGTAEISYLMETRRQTERLVVSEPAFRPDAPVFDPRRRAMVWGTLISMIAAVSAALFLDWRAPVVRSARQLERHLGIAPVVVIPSVAPPQDRKPLWHVFVAKLRQWRAGTS